MTSRNYGRLAFRHEGPELVAYYAKSETMNGAQRLGAIHFNLIVSKPHLRKKFISLMKDVVAEVMWELCNENVEWRQPIPPPAHEQH